MESIIDFEREEARSMARQWDFEDHFEDSLPDVKREVTVPADYIPHPDDLF